MSQQVTAGRGGRQTLSNAKYGASDDGVTVKTLSSVNSSTSYGSKKLYSSRDDQHKYRKEFTKSTTNRNGEIGLAIPPKTKPSSAASGTTTTTSSSSSASTTTNTSSSITTTSGNTTIITTSNNNNGTSTPASSKNGSEDSSMTNSSNKRDTTARSSAATTTSASSSFNQRGALPSTSSVYYNSSSDRRKHSTNYDAQDVEVRTYNSNTGSYRNSGSSRTAPARTKPDRGHSSSFGSAPVSVPQASQSSNSRGYNSNKYRNSPETRDFFRRNVSDPTLGKLLNSVAHDDSGHTSPSIKLLEYITDRVNYRSIVKSSISLWEPLLQLLLIEKSQTKPATRQHLISCLARCAIYSIDAQSRYTESVDNYRFYHWLFERYEELECEERLARLAVLNNLLSSKDLYITPFMAKYLVGEVIRLLDSTGVVKELFSVLQAVTYFAENHHETFTPVFMDVVDILAGWSVDPEQTEDTILRVARILVSLRPYWVENMSTCVSMTSNFLDDLQTMSVGTKDGEEAEEGEESADPVKFSLLIRLYQTFVKATGDRFNYKMEESVSKGYIHDSVSKMITSANSFTAEHIEGAVRINHALSDCIGTLADCGEDISDVPTLAQFMTKQSFRLVRDTNHSIIGYLFTLNKLYRNCDASNLLLLTKDVLSLDLVALKLSENSEVQLGVLELHRNWFATKDMETIQAAFKKTKEQIESCLALLTGETQVEWTDSRADMMRNKWTSQELILFHLTSLTQVATDTSNIILMYSLEPSIFNFLLKDILLVYGSRLKAYSSLTLHLIQLLHLHCNSNKNFIARSNLCAADTTRRSRHIAVNKSSGDNFSMILESMSEMFSLMHCNTHGLALLTQWIYEIVEQVVSVNLPLLNNILVVTMMTNVLSLDNELLPEICLLNIADALAIWIENSTLSSSLLSTIVDYTLYQLSSHLLPVHLKYLQIAILLPVDCLQRVQSPEMMKKHNQVLTLRRSIMSGSCGSFNSEQFRAVATLLLKQYTSSEDIELEWVQRLLVVSEKAASSSSDGDKSCSVVDQVTQHTGLLEHWLLWQAADFCVAHRLRTPIGAPRDTFMGIEAAIKQIAADSKIEVSPKCGADTKRVWMLLQFMENLEKALYNAYEGAAGQLTTHGKVVRSFFRTNRGTCLEWLTRIRLHILSIASSYGHPATVIRHGYELVTDMIRSQSTQTPEFELVLVYLTEAWCQLNCSEAIQGLYEWCKTACNRKLGWLKPFFLKAMNRYEEAATELKTSWSNMLSPPALGESIKLQTRPSTSVSAVTQLTTQQITDCYTSLQSWDEASDWLKEFDEMKSSTSALDGVVPVGHCDKMMLSDAREAGAEDLISWSKQQHITQIWKNSLQTSHAISDEEDRLKQASLLKIETSSDWPATIQPNTLLNLLSQQMNESAVKLSNLDKMTAQSYSLPWLLKLSELTSSADMSTELKNNVMIVCCREARKSGNLKLAHRVMTELSAVGPDSELNVVSLRIAREAAKQVYSTNNSSGALQKMSSICLHPLEGQVDKHVPELVARSTLTVAKWLQGDMQLLHNMCEDVNTDSLPSLHKLIAKCSEYTVDTPTIPHADKILGTMLQKSTEQCASLAKTWYYFGNWAYKWGRKCLDNAEQYLSAEEMLHIESFLPDDVTAEQKEEIMSVMSMVQGTFTSPDEELAEDSPDYGDDDIQEIRRRLISSCPSLDDDIVDKLVEFWTTTAKRAYTLYEDSAKAYFSYLNLCSNSQGGGHHNVTVTLRLLRLLVKHAWELRDVLESRLASTPTAPWRSIIPQLFSRLNHPELYVRQSVSELLARLADDYPHLIVYPAIVGCNQSTGQLDGAMPYMNKGDGSSDVDGSPVLTDCFQQLVDSLSSVNASLIKQVRTLVNELCRITVLWDEFWLGSLNQLNATASERIKALASEVERVKNNTSLTDAERSLLIREKRETIVKPLIHTIERLSDITGKAAETKHEQWFQETYSHLIEKGLQRLNNPVKDDDLVSDWQPFKQLHVSLQQRSQKRSSHMLKMKELSGVLASLTDTYIPLPGVVAKGDKQPITLQSVYSTLQILPTKTKPKKLAFLGSDGHKYIYLFKGLEDLHLDERIMQLLNIVNDMLVPKGVADSDCALYRARNYSVTPLGLRSGLISWVDGCLPLFALYKRWQVREAAAKPTGNSTTVSRPSEVLYGKLLPLLKPLLEDRGLNPKEVKVSEVEKIRKDWPVTALVTATKQLIAETPSHLVSKEIWCHSTSANEWWTMTQTYCRSVAVMSAIGYILGLGDRHLDNLLLDPNNGEMVHIDYNVCFDKGKSLRVPERVPFRLTSNMVAAMGATGVEGIFRSACEHTIKSMRLGKETLLTLLEAFVYDPLVDWTVGGETGLAGAFYGGNYAFGDAAKDYRRRKKQMERDITRSMFSIRVTEMKSAWLENREEMANALTEIVSHLSTFCAETSKILKLTEQAGQCRDILKYIEELKKEGGQAISKLTQRFCAHQKLLASKDECLKDVHSMSEEMNKYSSLHKAAIKAVTGPVLATLHAEMLAVPTLENSPSSLTRPFMQTVGQLPQLDQLEQHQEQLTQLVERRTQQMMQCKESLVHYATIIDMFPSDFYSSNHIMGDCLLLVTQLEQNFTSASCQAVTEALISSTRNTPSSGCIAKAAANEKALQAALSADVCRLEKLAEKFDMDDSDIVELIGQYEFKLRAIDNYRNLHGENGHRSLMFIVLPKLVEIAKKCVAMESTASKSEKRLHSLTSRDGDWFLNELAWVTDNMLQYVSLVQTPSTDESAADSRTVICTPILHHVIAGIQKVYAATQEMILNFQRIILPDILLSLIKGEPSVRHAIGSLNGDVIRSRDLSKMCSQLETMLRNIIFGAKEVDSPVSSAVAELRKAYNETFLSKESSAEMSKGVMLSKAFSGLFEHVYEEYTAAMAGLSSLITPKSWRKIDIIREAGELQLTQYNEKTKDILEDLFFVKQVMAMKDFYAAASQYVKVFTVDERVTLDSYDTLSRPLKAFIADFVRKQILGVASQSASFLVCEHLSDIGLDVEKEIALKDFGAMSRVSIDDLCKKGLDRRTQTGTQLSQANSLISGFELAWKKQDLTKRQTCNRLLLEELVSQQKRYLLCYRWLHEELLSSSASAHCQPTRKEVLTDLHRNLSAMMSTNAAYSEVHEKLTTSEGAIAQRLKWAAGANPQLIPVLSEFEKAQNTRAAVFQRQSSIVKDLNTYCHSILHLETMRTKSQEASNLESKFRQLINRCLEVCKTLEKDEQLSDQQRLMMSLMSKTDRQKTGNAFLGRAHDATQSHLSGVATKIKGLNKSRAQLIDKYKTGVSSLQHNTLNSHHKLISEVRAVLKTLAKEEMEEPGQLGCRVQNYLRDYKLFSERLASVIKMASQEQMTDELRDEIAAAVCDLDVDIESIFTRLIDLAKPLTSSASASDVDQPTDSKSADAVEQLTTTHDETAAAPISPSMSSSSRIAAAAQSQADKKQRDPKTGKAVQERNSYAVSVWRRVKMKLDGRELDPNKKMSVTDQVAYIISEATDIKNLAQMYEGWTSWV